MSEFTDGTMTGNTLSMVDMEKRLEALTEKCNTIPVIETGTTDVLDMPKASGKTIEVKFNHVFKTPPKVLVSMNTGGNNWTFVSAMAEASTTGALLRLWNDAGEIVPSISFTWMAIGQEA